MDNSNQTNSLSGLPKMSDLSGLPTSAQVSAPKQTTPVAAVPTPAQVQQQQSAPIYPTQQVSQPVTPTPTQNIVQTPPPMAAATQVLAQPTGATTISTNSVVEKPIKQTTVEEGVSVAKIVIISTISIVIGSSVGALIAMLLGNK